MRFIPKPQAQHPGLLTPYHLHVLFPKSRSDSRSQSHSVKEAGVAMNVVKMFVWSCKNASCEPSCERHCHHDQASYPDHQIIKITDKMTGFIEVNQANATVESRRSLVVVHSDSTFFYQPSTQDHLPQFILSNRRSLMEVLHLSPRCSLTVADILQHCRSL